MYDIYLERLADHQVRIIHEEGSWDDVAQFMWSDGNAACDCYRADVFAKAGGEVDPNIPCGLWQYRIVRVIPSSIPQLIVKE